MLKKIAKRLLAATLVFGMVFAYIPADMVFAAENYVDIDDAVTTTSGEAFKIQYEPLGNWNAESGYDSLFFDGTDHYSNMSSNEDYYTMNFEGTGIQIYGSKNVVHANCDVYIDEEYVGDVISRLDSGTTQHQQLVFEKLDLADGDHVLKVVRKEGETQALQVDMIRVYYEQLSVTSISLSAENVQLGLGESKQIEVTASPWVVASPEIEWTSADETVATVSADGVITATATAAAETTITATVKGSDVSATVNVTVDPATELAAVYVGDEKLLETQSDYEDLLNADANDAWNGTAWKGDVLNSKIVVAAKNQQLNNVTVSSGDFTNEAGEVISADNISIKWLKEIEANDGRNLAGVVNSYPDIIYQGGAAAIAAESVKFAWVNIAVPENAAAGTYTGTISVTADEFTVPISLDYTIEVLNLVQPEPEATEIQIWQHPFAVANYYLGLGATPTSGISYDLNEDFYFTEAHFNLMRASMEEYVSIGGHDVVANIVEEAWNHQSYYCDPSMVKWIKTTDGTWEFDYTWYDAWVNFAIECGALDPENGAGQIKCYSIVPWNNQIAYYDEASGTTVTESHTPGDSEWQAMWQPFLEDFMAHSKEMGWFEITYISMDERTMDQLEPAVEMIESVTDENGAHFKISSALNYAAPEYYDFTDRINDISINLGNCDQDQMNALSEHRSALGLTTTYYTCTGDYPSNFTISDPGDNYWNVWYTMTLGTDGYMRWAWDNYVYDMHGDVSYRYWEPGDGWFIYPVERDDVDSAYNAAFYSTPRYELFKQGVCDVAKAKYLMVQTDELNTEISNLVSGMQRPSKTTYNGSAVAANEEQRLLVHSETDRVYSAITDLAREYAASAEETTLEVSFVNTYAAVGEALTVQSSVTEGVTYQWYVDGKEIENATNSYTPTADDLETWIEVVASTSETTASVKMYCSKLPVVYIDTDGQEITSKETYIDATIKVQGNEEYSDSGVLYKGVTEIRGRGNSTWSLPKKPYRLKLDKKANMFGMGESKHWVLLANYLDESLMRNTLAYDLSGSMDMVQTSTVWVDVILNGKYVGNYQFCENIRVDDYRVEIFDWEGFAEESAEFIAEAEGMDEDTAGDLSDYMVEESMDWITSGIVEFNGITYNISDYPDIEVPSIDGGYLLELDEYYDEVSKFKTNSNQPIMFKNPEFVATNAEMLSFVQTYVQAFEDAVQSSDYTAEYEGADVHYSELYDFDSLVDYWLVSEIFYNEELNKKSTYMYKDIGGLMIMGPIWDMDWSSGAAGTSATATDQWATNYFSTNAQADQWYKDLVQDPYFLMKLQERYWEIRDVQIQDMLDSIDVHYEYLKESGAADTTAWSGRYSFDYDVELLQNWLNTHITWMDGQMATEDSFDAAFLGKDTSLALTLTDDAGEALEADSAEKAPADALAEEGEALSLQISGVQGTAKVYVNGIECVTAEAGSEGAEAVIAADVLTAEIGEKNVIEVKIHNEYGDVAAANYTTVKMVEAPEPEPTTPVTEIFNDVYADQWYVPYVQYVYDNGIMSGSEGTFAPTGTVTRAMVAETLYKMEGRPEVTDYSEYDQFTDLSRGNWWAASVAWAMNTNVATGDTYNMLFNPETAVTREQLATFLYRYANYKGLDTTQTGDLSEMLNTDQVNTFAQEAVTWAVGAGLISGIQSTDVNGNTIYDLAPQAGASRVELAAVLNRFCENYNI